LAFTRNPSDLSVSPATYKADGASDVVIADQPKNIEVDGSDSDDTIQISARGLAASTLTNYNVRAFDGDDTVRVTANVLTNSEINGNKGEDTMILINTSLQNSYFLGGSADDTITATNVGSGEVNGNKGNDTITVNGGTNTVGADIRGGKDNDVINVFGTIVDSTFYGDLGNDRLAMNNGGYGTSSAFGGEGIDTITHTAGVDSLVMDGGAGNDRILGTSTGGNTYIGGEGNDTITAGVTAVGETSTFDGGVGSDTITYGFGGGVNTNIFDAGDGVAAASGGVASGTAFGATNIVWNGTSGAPDVINNFQNATDRIDGDVTGAPVIINLAANNPTTLDSNTIYEVRGTYNAGTTTFTTAIGGADSIFIMGGANLDSANIFTTSDDMFILTGVFGGLTSANFI
jgi:Ca2+-binding RTX toxin-like protein